MGAAEMAQQLQTFRAGLYRCFTSWGDALFELTDAALCSAGPVTSIPRLSLEAEFTRSHGSLYKALAQGRIDAERLRGLLVEHQPADWPMVFAVDASNFERCDAECSPERGFYYSASRHSAGQPIVAGWHYQWICQLSWEANSWTAPVDVGRIPPTHDPTNATVAQLRALVARLPADREVPLFVLDAGYDPIGIGHDLAGERCEILCRIRDDRVFYTDAPSHPNRPSSTGGRPPRHGKRWKCSDETSWPESDACLEARDPRYGNVSVTAWHDMHPRLSGRGHWAGFEQPPIVKGSVIRVDVEHLPKPTSRTKKTLWLFWSGDGEPDLDRCFRAYLRRFDIEHMFRHLKQAFGWTTPKLATPAQADRWTFLIAGAYTELRLARSLVDDLRLPWEKPLHPSKLTPARVRRGFHRLRATLGTPASPPKSTKAGPGRPKGTRKPPRTRYPAVKKAA
jgi:hypothetical protein